MSTKTINPQDFGRVGVLMGGITERDVSLAGGELVLAALLNQNVDAHPILIEESIVEPILAAKVDRIFNVLHGGAGEDGTVQAILQALKIPYTDSGVLASSLAMDKERCKWLWRGVGLPTPAYLRVTDDVDAAEIIEQLGLPLVIKPICGGSSFGVTIVNERSALQPAIELAKQFETSIMAEQCIIGKELTVGIIGEQALPVVHIETPASSFYDYHHKYESNQTQYHCPSGLSTEQESQAQSLSIRAFKALGCRYWGRIDLMLDEAGGLWLLEANTITGMTSHSLVPKAAQAIGVNYEQLVYQILSMTC